MKICLVPGPSSWSRCVTVSCHLTSRGKMPTTVRFVAEVPAAGSLKERAALVIGTKASLSAGGVFSICKCVICAPRTGVEEDDKSKHGADRSL